MTSRPVRSTDATIAARSSGHERARIDHLGLDAVLGREAIGGLQRVVHEARERDDRDVAALAQGHGLPDRHRLDRLGRRSPMRK